MRLLVLSLAAGLVPRTALGAGSYDVVPFERLTSDFRVIIGVPADDLTGTGKDSPRVKYRRDEIVRMVDEHVARMVDTTDSLGIPELQYGFISSLEAPFADIFPRHTKAGARAAGLEDGPLPTPAVKLMNVKTKDLMAPDWPILLADFPDELDRLVKDFERWMGQSANYERDPLDSTLLVHGKNARRASSEHPGGLLTLFYAPWCHYSKLMLPKFAAAQELLSRGAWEAGLLPAQHFALGKVNVDHEAELRDAHNVTTYPQLKVLRTAQARAPAAKEGEVSASTPEEKKKRRAPRVQSVDFPQASNAAEIASGALASLSWAKGRPYAVLDSSPPATPADAQAEVAGNEEADSVAAAAEDSTAVVDSPDTFAKVVSLADRLLVEAAEQAASSQASEATGEDDTPPGEAKRSVVVLAVFAQVVPPPSRAPAAKALAGLLGGSVNTFLGVASPRDATAALAQLEGRFGPGASSAAAQEAVARAAAFQGGGVLVFQPDDPSPLFRPLPPPAPAGGEAAGPLDLGEELSAWLVRARWPRVARFDPSAAEQGERIRESGVGALCVLVGDEQDFMFEDFTAELSRASFARAGQAHFLFTDSRSPRVGPILQIGGVAAPPGAGDPPVLVLMSTTRAFAPRALKGAAITSAAIEGLLDAAEAEAAAREAAQKQPKEEEEGEEEEEEAAPAGEAAEKSEAKAKGVPKKLKEQLKNWRSKDKSEKKKKSKFEAEL